MLCAVHDAACCMHQPAHMRAFRLRTISAIVPRMQTHCLTHRCAPTCCRVTARCACAPARCARLAPSCRAVQAHCLSCPCVPRRHCALPRAPFRAPGYSFIMNTCSIMFLSTPARSMSLARTGSPSAASCTAAFISDASRALMSFKSLSRDISACAPSCDIS